MVKSWYVKHEGILFDLCTCDHLQALRAAEYIGAWGFLVLMGDPNE